MFWHVGFVTENSLLFQLANKSGQDYVVKIADFGLSHVSESGIYDASSGTQFPGTISNEVISKSAANR
jgi:hypothetical protein